MAKLVDPRPLSFLVPFLVIELQMEMISRHLSLSLNENQPDQIIGSWEKLKFSEPYFFNYLLLFEPYAFRS